MPARASTMRSIGPGRPSASIKGAFQSQWSSERLRSVFLLWQRPTQRDIIALNCYLHVIEPPSVSNTPDVYGNR